MYQILVINPGSTSTKIALFRDHDEVFTENLHHPSEKLAQFSNIAGQYTFRHRAIESFLGNNNIELKGIHCFVGRGGLLKPISSGTYVVSEKMLEDLQNATYGEHASNLGAILAKKLADTYSKPAFIVDPVVVDEMEDLARLSGHPELPRKSIFHALNHKSVARLAAKQLGKTYDKVNIIVVHLGGGISAAAHRRGRVVDVNNALDGDGPYTPERSGSLPVGDLTRLCFSGEYDQRTIQKMIKGKGGVVAYLGMNDMREVGKSIENGDQNARLIYMGMAYQVAKEIGALSTVLKGKVDAIAVTGGIAYDERFIDWLKERIQFIAPVIVFPGEKEMESLALGALRVLTAKEQARTY